LTIDKGVNNSVDVSGYTKLFSSIITSTIWSEPKETKILWITMLAAANKDGIVEGSVPGLACIARLSTDETARALLALESPDEWSRTKTNQGKRIKTIEGGWQLLNHSKYRALMSAEDRREYLRKKQAEHRAKIPVKKRQQMSTNVTSTSTRSTHSEADTEALKTERSPSAPRALPSLSEWVTECRSKHPDWPKADCAAAWRHYESQEWKRGKTPIVKWRMCVETCYQNFKKGQYNGNGYQPMPIKPVIAIPEPLGWLQIIRENFPESRFCQENRTWAQIPATDQRTIIEALGNL
jgi:hypothetical protein